MKKFSLLIALSLLASTAALLPISAQAQDAKAEFERGWYDTCYTKKDNEKCYQLSKELIEKYPDSQYKGNAEKIIKNTDLNKAWQAFQAALETYYKGPDAPKLEALFGAGDNFMKVEPDKTNPFHLFAASQMGLAGQGAAMSQTYKDLDRVKNYAEQAISLISAAPATVEKFKTEYTSYVDPLRDLVKANLNQYLAYRLIETKGDQNEALAYLAKSIEVRGKNGEGWKDPNNYWMRANIFTKQYEEVRKQYDALADDQKTGDAGKALLTQVNEVVDKMLPDCARVIVTSTKPEYKPLAEAATTLFDGFWLFRAGEENKAKGKEFIDAFRADPTVAAPAIPAKAVTDMTAPAAPVTTGTNVKVTTGTGAMAPGGKSAGATTETKTKAAPAAKGKRKPRR
ncbi:MAG: hypothetical protein SF339_27940 [Blastocatellia bacterium]|nr:hypothetical protein [Blastocatellia bacterium]